MKTAKLFAVPIVVALFVTCLNVFAHAQTAPLVFSLGNVGTSNTLNAVASGSNSFVAVGQNSTVMRGTLNGNTISFTPDTFSTPNLNLTAVTYGNGTYVAGGPAGRLFSNSSGTWGELTGVRIQQSAGQTGTDITSLAYNGSSFLASISSGTYVAYSTSQNLNSPWSVSHPAWPGFNQKSICAATPSNVVVVGNIQYSTHQAAVVLANGFSAQTGMHTVIDMPNVANNPSVSAVACSPTTVVVVGSSGTILQSISGWQSDSGDGVHSFFRTISSPVTTNLNAAAYTGTQFIAVGDGGVILTSPDGTTWTKQTSPTTQNLRAVAVSTSGIVMITGDNGTVVMGGTSAITVVPPNTTPANPLVFTTGSTGTNTLNAVTSGNNSFVAVGQNSTVMRGTLNGNTISFAPDTFSTPNLNLTAVTYGNGTYVAGGQDPNASHSDAVGPVGRLFSNSNGTWGELTGAGINYGYGSITGLAFSGNTFFVAPQITGMLFTSSNNLNGPWTPSYTRWLGYYQTSICAASPTNVLVSANTQRDNFSQFGFRSLVLASNDGGIHSTDNAVNGDRQTLLGIACSPSVAVAVGSQGNIVRSTNWASSVPGLPQPSTWTPISSPVTTNLNAVAYTGTQFIAVGDGGVILTSSDGTTWTKQTSPTTQNLRAVAVSSSGVVMITGDNGTVVMGGTNAITVVPPNTTPNTSTLTVTKSGTGSGTVTGSGISCGSTCTASIQNGTSVTLTATPDAGSTFTGWSGGTCTGTTATCTFTLSSIISITASFSSGGATTVNPPTRFYAAYPTVPAASTVNVTMYWVAASGNNVTGYNIYRNGQSIGTASQLTFTDTNASAGTTYTYTVKAHDAANNLSVASNAAVVTLAVYSGTTPPQNPPYVPPGHVIIPNQTPNQTQNYNLLIYISGNGHGTISGGSSPCSSSNCTVPVAQNSQVTLTATPDANSKFNGWDNNCHGMSPTCSVYVNGNTAVSASFAAYSATDTQKPSDPTTVQAVPYASGLWISWLPSTDDVGVAGYKVYLNGSQVHTVTGLTGDSVAQDASGQNLVPNTSYAIGVAAYDATGNTSNIVTVNSKTAADTLPPTVPTSITATVDANHHTVLTWPICRDRGGSGVASYSIYRDSSATPIGTVSQNSGNTDSSGITMFTYTDTSVTTGAHTYTISAVDNAGNVSAQSNPVSVTVSMSYSTNTASVYDADLYSAIMTAVQNYNARHTR